VINTTYGKEGLWDRFETEIASFPQADRVRLGRARDLQPAWTPAIAGSANRT
jgi:hypothetical protein